MSNLRESLVNTVDNIVEQYISIISKKYALNNKELIEIWKNDKNLSNSVASTPPPPPEPVPAENNEPVDANKCGYSQQQLDAMKKSELVTLCKQFKLKISGKKDDIVKRLIDLNNQTSQQSTVKTASKKQTVLQSLNTTIPTISVRRNKFGNYEHPETHLVFNKVDKMVYGRQNDNGTVDDLDKETIDLCNKFKFKYVLPENLNKTTTTSTNITQDDEDDEDEDDDEILEDDDILEDEDDDDLDEFYESGGED